MSTKRQSSDNQIYKIYNRQAMSCKYMNCTSLCCNSKGTCPQSYRASSGYSYTACSVYYSDIQQTINLGIYIGAGFGGLFLIMVIISIICYCYRKNKALQFLQQNRNQLTQKHMGKSNVELTQQSIDCDFNQPKAPSYYLNSTMNSQYQPYAQSAPNFAQAKIPQRY